ncbi:MAG: hypothetical protein AMXMBFR34_02300 [Myxococcaceae bacterium]
MRTWVPVVLLTVSGCATFPDAHLVSLRAQLAVQRADLSCGPVSFRRAALGARWGEYLKVTVSAPGSVSGEARLYVDRHPGLPVRFDTSPWTMPGPTPEGAPLQTWPAWSARLEAPLLAGVQQVVVVDVAWPNEQLDVASALPKNAPLELSVSGLATATGACDDVTFTVEQGTLEPTIGERAWVAEMARRAGPAWQAKLDAEARRRDEIRRAQVALVDARHEAERATQAERAVLAAALRQRHYAQWQERRGARVAARAGVRVAGETRGSGALQAAGGEPQAAGDETQGAQVTGDEERLDSSTQRRDGAAWCGASGDLAPRSATCGAPRAEGAGWLCGAPWQGACSSATGGAACLESAGVVAATTEGGAWTAATTCTQGTTRESTSTDVPPAVPPAVAHASPEVLLTGGAVSASADVVVRDGSAALPGSGCGEAAPGGATPALDGSWLASWPTVAAPDPAESEGWALPPELRRVEVSTTTEFVPPPLVEVTVEATSAASVVEPFLGFASAVLSGLLQAAPRPPAQPVHRAVPVKR